MDNSIDLSNSSRRSTYIILAFAAIPVLLHLYTNIFAGYGYFRDELYYIACSRHLAAGYVDQPPLSIFILFLATRVLGDSIFAIRLLPALMSGVSIYLVGIMTRKMNSGNFAVGLACLSVVAAPYFLGVNSIFSMNSFDWVFWSLGAYILMLIIERDSSGTKSGGLWIWLGVVLGLALLNKIDMLWFGSSLLIGLLLTPQRKFLKTIWPYISALIAFVLFSPYIIWNITHGFATLEFMHNASVIKYASQNPGTFLAGSTQMLNYFALPVWLAGIWFFFIDKEGKKFRLLGYLFLVSLLVLIANWHSKPEFLAPAFPILCIAGGVMFEKIIAHRGFRWIKFLLPGLIALNGLIALPFALPVLPVQTFISYSTALGIKPSLGEDHRLSALPQFYADMFGWQNMAQTVSKVYVSLPRSEQLTTAVFPRNYGEAGAIDFFRNKYPLPPVICGHNNYWFWGRGDSTFTTVITIGVDKKDLMNVFDSVKVADVIKDRYAMPYETNLPMSVCSGLKIPFYELWKRVKIFI